MVNKFTNQHFDNKLGDCCISDTELLFAGRYSGTDGGIGPNNEELCKCSELSEKRARIKVAATMMRLGKANDICFSAHMTIPLTQGAHGSSRKISHTTGSRGSNKQRDGKLFIRVYHAAVGREVN